MYEFHYMEKVTQFKIFLHQFETQVEKDALDFVKMFFTIFFTLSHVNGVLCKREEYIKRIVNIIIILNIFLILIKRK